MTLKQAKALLERTDELSIDEIAEALNVIKDKEKIKPISTLEKVRKAHSAWKLRQKESIDLRNEIKKYWQKSS